MDDRYAIGYCVSCCPLPITDPYDHTKTKPLNRRTVQLVRSDVWDPSVLAADRERRRIHRLFNGKGNRSEADYAEMAELRRRWAAEAEARRP